MVVTLTLVVSGDLAGCKFGRHDCWWKLSRLQLWIAMGGSLRHCLAKSIVAAALVSSLRLLLEKPRSWSPGSEDGRAASVYLLEHHFFRRCWLEATWARVAWVLPRQRWWVLAAWHGGISEMAHVDGCVHGYGVVWHRSGVEGRPDKFIALILPQRWVRGGLWQRLLECVHAVCAEGMLDCFMLLARR
jgi:hypothetical protein